jgi:putative transposase
MLEFKWRHFEREIILMSIRWYVAYSLSYRHIEELMGERGLKLDHPTIQRWVVRYSPELHKNFSKHKKNVGTSWKMDETYIKVEGKWVYLYRAVDKIGDTIDFMLSVKRDKQAAVKFFKKSISSNGLPNKITIDKSGSNKAGVETINKGLPKDKRIEIRQIKYLNNIVEQDHRAIKRIVKPMLGFKSFDAANATIAGIELHHMLRKRQNKNAKSMLIFEQFYSLAA